MTRQLTQHLQRIQYVTRHFQELQGLRYVPYALAVLGATVLVGGGLAAAIAGIVILAVGILLAPLVARYYTRVFGRTTRSQADNQRGRVVVIVLIVALVALEITFHQSFPVQYTQLYAAMPELAAALVLLVGFGMGERLRMRPYWAALGAALVVIDLALLLVGLGVLPTPSGVTDIRTFAFTSLLRVYLVPLTVAVAIGGVLDHRLLLRTFASRHADE
jgi:hypothetical protein